MKKIFLYGILLIATLYYEIGFSQTFPVKENNSFQNFQFNATGRNDVNAYLLAYLTRIVYVQYLVKDNGYTLKMTDTSKFRDKYIERTKHFFHAQKLIKPVSSTIINTTITGKTSLENPAPQYKWIWRSDGEGINPEAMFISTPDYILIVFRGTDRVEGANPFNYNWGEWIHTNFKFTDQKSPCSNCPGKVHNGFKEALDYAGFKTELINTIIAHDGINKKIWVTGHSLGGGFAQLFSYYLYKEGLTPQGVYVYNSPHPGDKAFSAELDRILPNRRLQRFEFISDPVAYGPPQTMNWIPGQEWGRAGTRNVFSKERSGGYTFNKPEQSGLEDLAFLSAPLGAVSFGGMCFHHPTWIVRGLYNLLPAEMQGKVPNPPAQIVDADEGCNAADINNGLSGNLIDAGTDQIAAGTYKIKNANSGRYLKATTSCFFNCCDLQQSTGSSGDAVLWTIEKVPNAIFDSYTIKSKLNSKVIDADLPNTGTNGCKVQLCDRLLTGIRTNQEWRFEKLTNGNFVIKCVSGDKTLRVAPGCSSQDGCRFELSTQSDCGNCKEWVLVKQ
ncbi:MAG: lipase family protein [Flavisolibacter sp.]